MQQFSALHSNSSANIEKSESRALSAHRSASHSSVSEWESQMLDGVPGAGDARSRRMALARLSQE